MKNAACKVLAGATAIVLIASAASAAVVGNFGDFTVFDSAGCTGVTFFDGGSNPSPFPAPVTIQISATWPEPGSSLTVGQMQTYLSGRGRHSDTFLVLFKKANEGVCVLNDLNVVIGGSSAASGTGSFSLGGSGVFAFDGNIDLGNYTSSDAIHVAYSLADQPSCDNLTEISLATAPEPVSLAFLGTGFLGLVCARLKRRPN